MTRLLVHVEGQTEETFVNRLLAPHLSHFGVWASARLLGNARQRNRRGGIKGWDEARRDLANRLREDGESVATLMVDYYGLPTVGQRAWPGRLQARLMPFHLRATTVQDALLADISAEMGGQFDQARFVPFVVMHEFEGLLFSECNQFATGIGRPDLAMHFQAIRDAFGTPEEINDSPVTAPSKRILELMPGYQKPTLGLFAATEIGLNTIRASCPNFAAWLTALENLGLGQA